MPTSKRLAGPGFIILNIIRAMNITGLLAACVASFIMLIRTFTASQVSALQIPLLYKTNHEVVLLFRRRNACHYGFLKHVSGYIGMFGVPKMV